MRAADRLNLQHSIYRAAGLLRAALLVPTVIINVLRVRQAVHPAWLVAVTLAMLGWTGAVWVWNQMPDRRTWRWMSADLVFTLALVASSRLILGPALMSQTYLGVTVYWMVLAPTVIGIWKGPVAGALTGLLVGAVNFVQVPTVNPRAWLDFVCMVMVAALAGFVADELSHLMSQRDQNFARAAALSERDRLNRIVHDGVLQALAMIEREGNEMGGRGADLARLAHDQESRLRDVLQGHAGPSSPGSVDLVALLNRHANAKVSVSSMASELAVPSHVAQEVDAAVDQALTNVGLHAGPDAQAWILIEEDDDAVVVSVRDNGIGMTDATVDRASAEGHLGIAESIEGRLRSVGGVATWRSSPGRGVEWELKVPKEDHAGSQ